MAKTGLKISTKIDGKAVDLELTELEVLSGNSICEKANVDKIIVMKKHNGGALFFINEGAAANCQFRQGFQYAFDVEAKDLAEKAEAITKAAPKKSENKGG